MATVGMKYPVYALLTETNGVVSYSAGAVLGKAISIDATYEHSDSKIHADDELAAEDKSFKKGSANISVLDLSPANRTKLLGHTAVTGPAVGFVGKAADVAPYVGFGFYGKKHDGKWVAIWYFKAKFAEPADNLATKQEDTDYKTTPLQTSIMRAADNTWIEVQEFATEAAAVSWLDVRSGLASKSAAVTSDVASGSYTLAQSVGLSTTESAGTIYYTDDGTIPSAANGTEFTADISLAKPSNTCIKAIVVTAGKANSDILELYITVTA